ncbi:TRAP transporter substrate-binding protein DctP [Mesorhizobium sp. L-8-3]|uniref:TRAP transporter substrate-binding protein DctP n=1 Tax=Mesorhizobium sp. L-8-3 TaxID=2744522 RepID=UPI001926C3B1|nr:TRAP transporter substrate-binding protein DctP [Mesorhizobium sp. L-8-3]BCH25768.1 ABC transporter substrate-binding protein [Mesorhizobium sp. L-8-3]
MTFARPFSLALALAALASAASAEEVTLRAISAFQAGTSFAKPFEEFVANVNENGKGVVQIQMIGGPEAMPPMEIGNALRGKVVDLANSTAVFHANLVPEGVALTLTNRSMAELRENGGYELMNKLHEEKAGIHWLGRLAQNIPYHIYLAKAPENESVKDLKLRSVPVYQAFFAALGAQPVQMAPGDVYTALERGAVDGYGWPAIGVFDLGWQEKTKARIDPGFYNVETGIYMSQKAWNALSDEQKAFLQKEMVAMEDAAGSFITLAEEEGKKQQEAGIAMVGLPADKAAAFEQTAQDAGWQMIISASPDNGPKLRELLMK